MNTNPHYVNGYASQRDIQWRAEGARGGALAELQHDRIALGNMMEALKGRGGSGNGIISAVKTMQQNWLNESEWEVLLEKELPNAQERSASGSPKRGGDGTPA